jgi:hypothetical protein
VEQKRVNADDHLLRILGAQSDRIAGEQGFKKVVKQSVLRRITPEFPNLNQVTSHLNRGTRTVPLKLKIEGITFTQMWNELRFEMAKK